MITTLYKPWKLYATNSINLPKLINKSHKIRGHCSFWSQIRMNPLKIDCDKSLKLNFLSFSLRIISSNAFWKGWDKWKENRTGWIISWPSLMIAYNKCNRITRVEIVLSMRRLRAEIDKPLHKVKNDYLKTMKKKKNQLRRKFKSLRNVLWYWAFVSV